MAAGRKAIDISEWLTPENKLRIQGWCRDGLIEKQIYKNMGIGKSTFYKWKNENVEFAELLKESKETADREAKLEAAGYNYDEVQKAVNALCNKPTLKSVSEIAKEVLAGKWGNGEDRKNKLTAAGYNYNEVQAAVNSLNKKSVTTIAKEVIAGKWGNGSDRKKKLESAGYNYNEVQKEVNRLL